MNENDEINQKNESNIKKTTTKAKANIDSEDMRGIRQRIFDRKEELDISYDDLGVKAGISKSTLQRYIKGSIRNIPLNKLMGLANALNVTPSYIMNWESPQPQTTKLPTENKSESYVILPIYREIKFDKLNSSPENIESFQYTDESVLEKGQEYFYFRSKNESMKDAGIFINDLVLLKKQSTIESGELALVQNKQENVEFRRIIKQKNIIILKPENSSNDLEILTSEELNKLTIFGKVILAIHCF